MQWLTQPVWTSAQRVYLLYGSDDKKRSLRSRHPPPFIQFIKSTDIGTDGRILLHQARPVRLVPARSCYCSGGVYCLHRWVAHLSIYLATQHDRRLYGNCFILSLHICRHPNSVPVTSNSQQDLVTNERGRNVSDKIWSGRLHCHLPQGINDWRS